MPVASRPYFAMVALTLLIAAGAAWWFWTAKRPSNAGRAMLAVLPFANLTGDPGQRSFGDGMTEEIITDLGRLDPRLLGVIARTSVLRYADTTKSIQEIGRELGVAYIVEGSVRREPDKVRITAQLIRVRDQSHIWAQAYDRQSGATLALESDVAAAIAQEVNGRVAPDRRNPLLRARARDPEAYALYFQGRELWNRRTEDSMRQAIDRFEAAIARDPLYAAAFAGLADTYTALGYGNYLSPSEAFSKARKAAEKALELDPDAPEPHASLGYINMYFDWNFPAAEAEFRKSIELNPSSVLAHDWYAILMLAMGRGERSTGGIGSRLPSGPLLAAAQDRCWIPASLPRAQRTGDPGIVGRAGGESSLSSGPLLARPRIWRRTPVPGGPCGSGFRGTGPPGLAARIGRAGADARRVWAWRRGESRSWIASNNSASTGM